MISSMDPEKIRKRDEDDPFRAFFRLPVAKTRFVEVNLLDIPPLSFPAGTVLARIMAKPLLSIREEPTIPLLMNYDVVDFVCSSHFHFDFVLRVVHNFASRV